MTDEAASDLRRESQSADGMMAMMFVSVNIVPEISDSIPPSIHLLLL